MKGEKTIMSSITVSGTPHVRSKDSVQGIMRDVIIALIPATVVGIINFGANAALLVAISIIACVFFEWLYQKLMKKPCTIKDLSAVVTGLLLAMNLPSTAPWYVPVVGAAFCMILCKQFFGGIGKNFVNPALIARAFLVAAYPVATTGGAFLPTNSMLKAGIDAATYATPLANLKAGTAVIDGQAIMDAFLGNIGGCIGETCALALIIGGVYLLVKQVISWRIPVVYMLTVFVLTLIMRGNGVMGSVYELFVGGLMLGSIFMATDYTTSPTTPKGQIFFAIGCGLLTSLIRVYGGYPEGVSYSILIMNLTVPLIERYTKPTIFGALPKEGKKA